MKDEMLMESMSDMSMVDYLVYLWVSIMVDQTVDMTEYGMAMKMDNEKVDMMVEMMDD